MIYKKFIIILNCIILFLLSFNFVFSVSNSFTVDIAENKKIIYEGDIIANYKIKIKNNLNVVENFSIKYEYLEDWELFFFPKKITILPNEEKEINLFIKYKKNIFDEYQIINELNKKIKKLLYTFPITITSSNFQSTKFSFELEISEEYLTNKKNKIEITNKVLEKNEKFYFKLIGNFFNEDSLNLKLFLDNKEIKNFRKIENKNVDFKIYVVDFPENIIPKIYDLKILVKKIDKKNSFSKEWKYTDRIEILSYKNLYEKEYDKNNLFYSTKKIIIENKGNIEDTYYFETPIGFFKNLLITSNENFYYENSKLKIEKKILANQKIEIKYRINYYFLYLFFIFFLIIIFYFSSKKFYNPVKISFKHQDSFSSSYTILNSKFELEIENISRKNYEEVIVIIPIPFGCEIIFPKNIILDKKVQETETGEKLIWTFSNFEKNEARIFPFKLKYIELQKELKFKNLEIILKNKNSESNIFKELKL